MRRLVVNGVYWGLGLDVPAKADVAVVDPYQPLMYGFKAYRIGLKPSTNKHPPSSRRRLGALSGPFERAC